MAPNTDGNVVPVDLWLTDRTRWKTGLQRCARERYLGNHAGPLGYGLQAGGEHLPLATGAYFHDGLADMHRSLQKYGQLPGAEAMRELVMTAQQAYEQKVQERGFRGIAAGPDTDETIAEQKTLISSLLWIARVKYLPWLHEHYEVIEVEQERIHLLDCSCGAGPLPVEDHLARGCQGPGLMLRTDLLARNRAGGNLAYFEFKTSGWDRQASTDMWELDPQLGIGTLDLQERYGVPVTELYVVVLLKGARAKDRYANSTDTRKKQQTALCYGQFKAGNPPVAVDDWLPSYEWVDDEGMTKRASKQHRKRGVWHLPESDWPFWLAYHRQDPGMTPEELWVRQLPASVIDKVVHILGPMNPQDAQIQAVRRGMQGEEARWQAVLWQLYEAQTVGGMAWGSEEFQRLLDRLVPQSWACRPFGKDNQCQFVGICHRHNGWQDPMQWQGFKTRRPHHQPELDQAIARGLMVDEAAEAGEEE